MNRDNAFLAHWVLPIELQVNLKTGTEILNRIKGMEQDLRGKSDDVQEIKSKVKLKADG